MRILLRVLQWIECRGLRNPCCHSSERLHDNGIDAIYLTSKSTNNDEGRHLRWGEGQAVHKNGRRTYIIDASKNQGVKIRVR